MPDAAILIKFNLSIMPAHNSVHILITDIGASLFSKSDHSNIIVEEPVKVLLGVPLRVSDTRSLLVSHVVSEVMERLDRIMSSPDKSVMGSISITNFSNRIRYNYKINNINDVNRAIRNLNMIIKSSFDLLDNYSFLTYACEEARSVMLSAYELAKKNRYRLAASFCLGLGVGAYSVHVANKQKLLARLP